MALRIEPMESGAALRGWKFNQDGGKLYIHARKAPASPLFGGGSYETSIDLGSMEEISFDGRVIRPYAD